MQAGRKQPRRFPEKVSDLLDAGLLHPGDQLRSVRKALTEVRANLRPDGRLEVDGKIYGSLSAAAVDVSLNKTEPGWEFWAVERDSKLVTLYELREQVRESRKSDDSG